MRRFVRWLFALVPLAGALELALAASFRGRAPEPQAYDALPGALASTYRDGDLVVVAPRWAEPHARRALGDAYFPIAALARSDEGPFERAIEISVAGARAKELSSFRELERREVGPFVVRTLENPAYQRVVFDFVEGLVPRWASAGGTEPETKCTWSEQARIMTGGLGGHPAFPRKRFECPDGPYLNVSATVIADERFLPRRCIWAHPTWSGARFVRFSGVPLGRRIVGHMGMYWMIEREKKGEPVELAVSIDGERIATFTHEDGEGWEPFEVDLGDKAGQETATVSFEVSSTNYKNRHFCFQADTR